MKQKMYNIRKQNGMTLLEVLAALGIGAIIIMGALALFNSGSSAANANALTQSMTSMRSSVRAIFLGQGSYGTASLNSTLISAGKIPATWTSSGSTITNNYGGAVVVTGATSTFNITSGSIPQADCVSSLPQASQGWSFVGTGASAAAALAAATNAAPVSPATATTLCSASTQFIALIN